MEIEFVVGEWTCKSIPLFITIGRLVFPDVLMALLPDFALYGGWRTIMEIEFVLGEWTCKSIPLFITTGRLVCPDVLWPCCCCRIVRSTERWIRRTIMELKFVIRE